ncbi:MAG: aminotransferase class I/II-fold pyridoxal phosphate-dependent enzyme [Acidovorax sp.]|nr:MAG: aminotransferase class I/II-fold pyridoxal phosphate-dependent enzyme [Acidovorax sp.]
MRLAVENLEASKIREVANAGMGRADVLAFWFGESDEVTPEPIRQAAIESLQRGETFYSHNLGLPDLRQAVASYASTLHRPIAADRIAVTSGGVSALMIAMQALLDAGDEVVAVTPVWPNLTAQPAVLGTRVHCVPLRAEGGAWTLDLQALLDAITPATRLLIVNAPNNPTGWTLTRAEQQAILEHCRRTGTWILADEVYERLYYGDATPNGCAPSFLDISDAEDRLIVVQSFSKSFLMTGWRLGWLVLPPTLVDAVGKLIEFNTSCSSVFTQRAGLAALEHAGEIDDSLAVAQRLVSEAGLGLAPGNAFAPEAQGWLRWCFASKEPARLEAGVQRLQGWLETAARSCAKERSGGG